VCRANQLLYVRVLCTRPVNIDVAPSARPNYQQRADVKIDRRQRTVITDWLTSEDDSCDQFVFCRYKRSREFEIELIIVGVPDKVAGICSSFPAAVKGREKRRESID
jgi:hypothetical protein